MSELLTLIEELDDIYEILYEVPGGTTARARLKIAQLTKRLRAEAAAIDAEVTKEMMRNDLPR